MTQQRKRTARGNGAHAENGNKALKPVWVAGVGDHGATPRGTLLIIGGHEDKEGDRLILRALVERAESGALVVATVASQIPHDVWGDYEPLFRDLGVRDLRHLHVESREQARTDPKLLEMLDGASAVFFTGGDQLKLTSQLGDTPVYTRVREIYEQGGTIAGTSAGASVMCETMLVQGEGSESHRIGTTLRMAPGFGFIPGVIIDQHFAERGRMGRLIGAVAQNPRIVGIGIDEDTAILCSPDSCFTVLGSGAVSVLDGRNVSYSNLTDEGRDRTLSAFNLCLHQLSMGDEYDLATRAPTNRPAEELEEALVGRS
jgi:cyanophycinase